jgi:PHP family Zn ribbon phosphoesterase
MNRILVECDSCKARYDTVAPRSAVELVRRCDNCGGRLRLVEEQRGDDEPHPLEPPQARD